MKASTAALVLGIDTATEEAAVALVRGEEVLAERSESPGEEGRPRHSAALLATVEELVELAGGWEEVDLIGVGVGPGSFTGLRVGIATARALAQATARPIAAVGSLDALDRGLAQRADACGRPRLVAIDARRREAFAQLRAPDAGSWGPFAEGPEALAERLTEGGPAPLAAGSGSLRFRAELEAAGAEVLADAEPEHRIEARHVCALASGAVAGGPESIEPIYLRRPDAELWRERIRDGTDKRT